VATPVVIVSCVRDLRQSDMRYLKINCLLTVARYCSVDGHSRKVGTILSLWIANRRLWKCVLRLVCTWWTELTTTHMKCASVRNVEGNSAASYMTANLCYAK